MNDRAYNAMLVCTLALLVVWTLAMGLPPDLGRAFASAALGAVFGISSFIAVVLAGVLAAQWIAGSRRR